MTEEKTIIETAGLIISDPDSGEKLCADWTGLEESCWMSRSARREERGGCQDQAAALIIARCWRAPLLTANITNILYTLLAVGLGETRLETAHAQSGETVSSEQ